MRDVLAHAKVNYLNFALPLLSALLLIFAFPPFEQGYLAWFALLPFLWFCLNAAPRQALLGGVLFGIPLHLYLNLYLLGVLFNHLSPFLTYLTMILLLIILCSFNAVFAYLTSYACCRSKGILIVPFITASIYLIVEYSRSLSFIGYNVGYLGYTQWSYPAVLNIASVYGYWGLPFIMVLWQTVLVLLFMKLLKGRKLLAALIAVSLLAGIGLLLPNIFDTTGEKEELWTAFIQGNSSPEEILSAAGKREILNRYINLTMEAKEREPRLELVVWPETVVDLYGTPDDLSHNPRMKTLAAELNINILYGARVRTEDDLFNAVVLLTPNGSYSDYYKQRLVPFVEYFPMSRVLNNLLDLNVILGSYTPGWEKNLFVIADIPVAGVVCFESYFGDYTRHFARQGSKHLFILTNDVWFGETIGLEQHAQVAAIRAAEMGRGVTQVANSGITISFDYRGNELFRSGKMEQEIFILPLGFAGRPTIYAAAGDYFPALWAAFLIVLITYHKLRKN